MWGVVGNNLTMTEADFGVGLKTTLKGISFSNGDSIRFTFKDKANGETILTKEITTVTNNQFTLILSQADSLLLPIGTYVYSADWYKEGNFMCCIVEQATLKVGDKA